MPKFLIDVTIAGWNLRGSKALSHTSFFGGGDRATLKLSVFGSRAESIAPTNDNSSAQSLLFLKFTVFLPFQHFFRLKILQPEAKIKINRFQMLAKNPISLYPSVRLVLTMWVMHTG